MLHQSRKGGRWFRGVGRRESFLAPAAVYGFTCGLVSVLLLLGWELYSTWGLLYPLQFASAGRWAIGVTMLLAASGVVAVVAFRVASGGRRASMRPRSIAFVAHAAVVVAFTLGGLSVIPFGESVLMPFPERRRIDKKLAIYLPCTEDGVGRPPDDGTPQVVVTLGPRRAAVAGSAVEPTREALRRAIEAETERLGVTPRTVRVRFDVAPEVTLQAVIVALDAMLMAGTTDGWFSGVR